MNKVFIRVSALAISLMVLATSCKKTTTGDAGPAGATGATGPELTGSIQGLVSIYDVSGTKMLASPTNTLSLAGDSIILTNVSSHAVMKTTTSTNGTYTFTNVSTGTYSSTVTRPGFGTVLAYGSQFVGGGTAIKDFELSAIPTTTITSATAVDTTYTSTGVNYVKVRGYVPVSTGVTTVIIYVSQSINNYVNTTPGNFSTYYTTTVAAGATKFSIAIPTSGLYDLGFPSGGVASVYFDAYILGGNTSASTYADWATQQTVFTALSPAAVSTSALVQ